MANEIQPASAGTGELYLPPKLRKPRLRSDEASEYLRVAHGVTVARKTLDKLRCVGGGPEFEKFGVSALYRPASLDAWALAKISAPRRSTSHNGAPQ
ncbi:MAG TPA: hypothetical protein VIG36_04540 [Methylocystis sp.]|jgi:hypothetical protein